MNYYDYNDNMQLVCGCGWKGTGKEADTIVQDQFLDIRCPRVECDWPLLKVPYPTYEESLQASKEGKDVDPADLMVHEIREDLFARWEKTKLYESSQLPDIQGDRLEFVWDAVGEGVWDSFYVIKHGDTVVWKEYSFYEDAPRFPEIVEIFKKKYGSRYKEMAVTWSALRPLIGDKIGYWSYVQGCPILEEGGRKRWDLTT